LVVGVMVAVRVRLSWGVMYRLRQRELVPRSRTLTVWGQ
jgi:hypothetical protein